MFDVIEYSSSASEHFADEVETKLMKKKKSKNKIRFTEEQIRSLEVIFESETKLESRKKVQLAKELGLQPRQVAIWFQNKRARWKSKQIEKDYNVLLSSYNNLVSQFDSLKKDNQSLLIQLEKLKNEMKVGGGNMSSSTISDEGEYNKNMDFELLRKDYQREHEQDGDHELLMKIVEPVENNEHSPIVTTSHEDWGGTLEMPHNLSYLSWDFWS